MGHGSTLLDILYLVAPGSADTLRGLGQILGMGPHMRAQDTNNTDCLLVLWVKPRPILAAPHPCWH